MRAKVKKKYTVKSYKTVSGRQLYFIKSKKKVNALRFFDKLKFFQYKSDDPKFTSYAIKYKYNIEDIKKAEQEVKKEKTKKKKLWSWLFLGLNILIVAGIFTYQILTGDAIGIGELFSIDAKWNFLLLAILMVLCSTFIESTKTFYLIYVSTHRIRPFLSYKSTTLCRYYDSISPMSTAGEPFQIYYLKKRGIRGEIAASIPIVKSLFWQVSNSLVAVVLLTFNRGAYAGVNPIVATVAWVSIAFNVFVLLLILFLSLSKKVAPRIVIGILKLLAKMHIVKNYQLTFRKVMRFVINYQNCMRTYATNGWTILIELILALGEILVTLLVPYFIYRTFMTGLANYVSALDIMTLTTICNMASLIIPIPGGSGMAEFSFIAMFSALFTNGTAVWAMLIWRILTYYQYIIQGLGVTIYDTVYGNKKANKLVASGYFNDKVHIAMIRRKKKKSSKIQN